MFNKGDKIFSLRKTVISLFCLIFALSIAGVFAWQIKQDKPTEVQQVSVEKINTIDPCALILKWSKELQEDNFNVIPISDSPSANSGAYHFTGEPSSLSGGTTITLSYDDTNYTSCSENNCNRARHYILKMTGGTTATVVLHIHNGYTATKIKFADKNDNLNFTWDIGNSDHNVTTEEIDPNYTGTIKISADINTLNYTLNKYHENASNEMEADTQIFTVNGPVDGFKDPCSSPSDYEFAGWYLKTETAPNDDGIIVIDTLTFESDGTSFVDDGTWYKITNVCGYVPNYTSGEDVLGQSLENIFVKARWIKPFNVIVDNSFADYWSGFKNENGTNKFSAGDLFGVKSFGDEENEDNIVPIRITNSTSNTFYMTDNAFSKNLELGSNLFVAYNYGFYISGYQVFVNLDGTTKCLNYTSSYWTEVEEETTITNNISGGIVPLGTLSQFANANYYSYSSVVFTIKPIWTGVTIDVKNAKGDSDIPFVKDVNGSGYWEENCEDEILSEDVHAQFGEQYTLLTNTIVIGETFFSYSTEETPTVTTLVSHDGVWNYLNLTDMYTKKTSSHYEISVYLVFLEDIYKATLDIPEHYDNWYRLTKTTGYEFNVTAGLPYENDCIDWTQEIGENYNGRPSFKEVDNTPLYSLVDDYLIDMFDQYNAYSTECADDGFGLFNKVFWQDNSGDSDDTYVTSDDNESVIHYVYSEDKFYIYLVRNSIDVSVLLEGEGIVKNTKTNLPVLMSSQSKTIGWKFDGNNGYFAEAGNHNSKYHWINELYDTTANPSGIINTTQFNCFKTTLVPYYAYRHKCYYVDNDDSDGVYSYVWTDWYTSKTSINLLPLDADNQPAGKTFSSWYVDGVISETENGGEYAVSFDGGTNKVAISKTGVSATYAVEKEISANKYVVSSVYGAGVFAQNDNYPIVKALYTVEYDYATTIINNGEDNEVYWHNAALGGDSTAQLELYGVGVGDAATRTDSEGFTGEIIISNSLDYRFLTSTSTITGEGGRTYGLSFYKQSAYLGNEEGSNPISLNLLNARTSDNSKYYYVYNYGYYVSSWEIKFTFGEVDYWYNYDNNQWYRYKNTTKTAWEYYNSSTSSWVETQEQFRRSSLGNLSDKTTQNLAVAANTFFAYEQFLLIEGTPTCSLIPHWTSVNINVKSYSSSVGTTTYAGDYLLSNTSYSLGQSIFAYEDEEDKMIALSGCWNYKEIPHGNFEYSAGTGDSGSGTYTINVTPYYVDNIYKIKLNGMYAKSGNTYVLENTDFIFADSANKYAVEKHDFTTYSTITSTDYEYITYADHAEDAALLIETYIDNALSGYLSTWEDKIANSSFNIFKKVNYSTGTVSGGVLTASSPNVWIYLANNQDYADLPAFDHDYAMLIMWNNANSNYTYKTNEYDNDGNNETDLFEGELHGLTLKTDENAGKWSVNDVGSYEEDDEITFNAHHVYNIRMYYEDRVPDKTLGENYIYNSKLTAQWYGANTPLPLIDEGDVDEDGDTTEYLECYIPTDKPNDIVKFKNWIFNETAAETRGFNVVVSGGIITVTKDAITLKMTYSGQNTLNSYLYHITSFQGSGILVQDGSLTTSSGGSIVGTTNPIILAQWAKQYNITLNNSLADTDSWSGLNDRTLNGAYSKTGDATNEAGGTTTSFIITDDDKFAYPFLSSEYESGAKSTSFFHKDDWNESYFATAEDGYYYAYNYGYYISGWELYQTKNISFKYDDATKWTKFNPESNVGVDYSEINELKGQTLQNFTKFADDYYALQTGEVNIAFVPVWEKVNIKVIYSEDGSNLITKPISRIANFASDYSLNVNVTAPEGKKLFAYSYVENDDDTMISLNGKWNYKNIDNHYYPDYTEGSTIGGGTHTITVYPVWLDSIYKVNLTNATIKENNTFVLSNCDYTFNGNSGEYGSSGENVISYDSADLSYGYLSYQNYNKSKAYIDTYIEDLINYKSNYIKGINCDEADDFALFRRVYYSIEGKSLSADSLSLEMKNGADVTNVKFHIYLANGQNTGDLPVFEKDFYTLIYWKNIAENEELTTENKHYVYPTEEFDREDEQHWAEIKRGSDWLYGIRDGGLGFNNVWYYSDGYNADNSVTFEAGYFRKRYDLNIQTYLEDILSRRGYVMIDIYDNLHAEDNNMTDTGGRYIAIFETGRGTSVMELYQVLADSTLQTDTSLDAKKLDSVINATGKITSTKVDFPIKLYAGCDITMKVYDQSQDSEAMSTGFFDEMIGYKFSGKVDGEVREGASVVEKSLLFSAENATNYVFSLNEDEVEAKDYVNGAEIDINVYFEKIVYNINFEIDNVKAGEFNVQANTQFSGYKTKYTLNNMIVDDYYSVNYYAYAGFKLQEDAFVLNNGKSVSTLKTYDDANVLADSQDYTLTTANVTPDFYGTWLRLYFYNDYDLYPVDKTNIGTIIIKTEAIEFVYGVKIYDETNTTLADDNYILETFYYVVDESGNPVLDSGGKLQRTTEMVEGTTYATISLDEKTGIKAVYNVNTYLTKENLDFWYYNSLGGTNYALLSSRMWFPNNQTTTTKNSFYTTYEFLIDSENGPEDKFELSTYILEYMVDNYEDGKIISNNDRNIYIMLEVRRLLEIDMRVGVLDKDTNSTSRITTLSNSTNNSKSIILRANAGKVNNLAYSLSAIMGYYYVDTNNNASLVVYSYYGLENRLTSVYDDTRYTGVEYYLNGASEKMTENKFTLDADATLEIVYIPSSLAVEFVYSLDSGSSLQIVNYDEIKEYINDENVLKPNTYSMYYMNDIVTYMVECIHADYNLRVTINGVVKGSTGTVRKVQTYHTITDMDYEIGSVKIEVDVYLKNNSQITIKYQLLNPEQREADDDYGTFSVVDDAENQNTTSCAVTVIEGRSVYVTLNLNTGYRYAGKIKHSTNDAEEVSIVDEKLLIVSSYNPETDNGDYLIMVEKQLISAALDTTGLQASYSINGTKELTGLYVGKTITLEHTDVNEERLGCFYYLASRYDEGSGTYQPYNVYLTEDGTQTGNPLTSLKITSALLEQVNSSIIQFKVVAINRYKLDLVIEGEEYKKADSLQVKFTTFDGANWVAGEDYVLGSYCDEGTNITVAVETLVEGKYTITFNSTYDVLNLNDEIISLDENKQLTLEIAPKTYNVVIEENVYTTLAEVATSSPKVETSQVNGVDNSQKQQTYNNLTILEFRRFIEDVESVDDRELSEVYITGNDFEDLILIEFNGDEFEVYKVVGDVKNPTKKELVDLSSYGFAIELTGYGTVRLTYTTFNNINVRFDYKLYKTIRVE